MSSMACVCSMFMFMFMSCACACQVREASLEELALSKAQTASMSAGWVAAREGDFRFMGLWLRLGRPLDDIEGRGETLLIAAVGVGQHVMLAFLLQARVACAWRVHGVCVACACMCMACVS